MLLLIVFNYILAKTNNENPLIVIAEHVALAAFVVVVSYFVGDLIGKLMN